MSQPAFCPGDEVMLVCPAGAPPFPEGPLLVRHCTHYDARTEVSEYVVEHPDGRLESVDGFELMLLEHWLENWRTHAN